MSKPYNRFEILITSLLGFLISGKLFYKNIYSFPGLSKAKVNIVKLTNVEKIGFKMI